MVMVPRSAYFSPSLDMPPGGRLQIPAGGSATVSYSMSPPMPNASIHLELSDPPAGVTLQDVSVIPRGYMLTLKADDKHTGYADNLIVEAFTENNGKGKASGPPTETEGFPRGPAGYRVRDCEER